MGVLLLPSTRCRCRQQKQLGFLWSDMIVKRLITSSSSSSSAASIQLGQLQDDNISRPLHRSSLEVIMKRVVGIVRIGSAGQLCSFTSAFLTKVLDFLKCEMQFPPFFFFFVNSISHLQPRSHAEFMRCSQMPRREFLTVDCGKQTLNTDCAVVVSLNFSFLSCLA